MLVTAVNEATKTHKVAKVDSVRQTKMTPSVSGPTSSHYQSNSSGTAKQHKEPSSSNGSNNKLGYLKPMRTMENMDSQKRPSLQT